MLSWTLREGRIKDDLVLYFFHNMKLPNLWWSKLYLLRKPVPFSDSLINNYTMCQTLARAPSHSRYTCPHTNTSLSTTTTLFLSVKQHKINRSRLIFYYKFMPMYIKLFKIPYLTNLSFWDGLKSFLYNGSRWKACFRTMVTMIFKNEEPFLNIFSER